jgi:hypothetical protein
MFDNLNDENYLLYAAKEYDKPNAVMSEFEEDLNRILYIKRLLTKYHANKVLKDRLIINHLVVLFNVFGIEASNRLLFLKLDEKDYEVVKPFLLFLHYLPEKIRGIKGKDIITQNIRMDEEAVLCLRKYRQ